MKKVIEFLKGVDDQKNGLQEFEQLKPTLSSEEIELIETVFKLLANVSHWAGEKTFCAVGVLVEEKEEPNPKALLKAIKILATFKINPFLIVKFIRAIGLEINPLEVLKALKEETLENLETEEKSDALDDDRTLEDIQKELAEKIRKFNQN